MKLAAIALLATSLLLGPLQSPSIEGVLLDSQTGKPLPGVTVQAEVPIPTLMKWTDELVAKGLSFDEIEGILNARIPQTVSGADGRFRLGLLNPGRTNVIFRNSGRVS